MKLRRLQSQRKISRLASLPHHIQNTTQHSCASDALCYQAPSTKPYGTGAARPATLEASRRASISWGTARPLLKMITYLLRRNGWIGSLSRGPVKQAALGGTWQVFWACDLHGGGASRRVCGGGGRPRACSRVQELWLSTSIRQSLHNASTTLHILALASSLSS